MKAIAVGVRHIGPGQPCFIVAEAGVNHNGDLRRAKQLVDVAVSAGADAVKFQTFRAERLASPTAPTAVYQQQATGVASQFEMLRQLELSPEAHQELYDYCRARDITFLSTPFEEASADFLQMLGVPLFKIPSGELTNTPFLAHVAGKGVPLILSTGMASLEEVTQAVDVVRASGNEQLIVLHCVSAYPADPADMNLRAMHTLADTYGVPVGLSDHTRGTAIAIGAVALGASVIEKHITLDRRLPGPDHAASLEPDELRALVQGIRDIERALGDGCKQATASEANTATVARKSLVAAGDIPAGTVLSPELIAIQRPGTGLPPAERPQLVGRVTRATIPAGTLLDWSMIQ